MRAAGWSEKPEPGYRRVVFVDAVEQKEYLIEVANEEVLALRAEGDRLGVSSPSAFEPPGEQVGNEAEQDPDAMYLRGWSNGVDNRVNKQPSTPYPTQHTNLRRSGHLNAAASMVGRRIVITAAHSILFPDGTIGTNFYRARRYGNIYPYASELPIAYAVDAQYYSNGCPMVYGPNCAPWDWAVAILPENAHSTGLGSPGWFGYDVPPFTWSLFQGWTIPSQYVNDGYPVCGLPASPSGCLFLRQYGQTALANGVLPSHGDPNDGGAWTLFKTGADASIGHSGGPFYRPVSNVLYGHLVTGDCDQCSPSDTHPNNIRAITP